MTPRAAFFALAASAALAAAAHAAPLDVSLTFGSLPSAQGFAYNAVSAHAGVTEPTVFSVDGTMLTQNTIGQYLGTNGGSILYQRLNGITTTEPKQIRASARCTQVGTTTTFPLGQGGFCFIFAQNTTQYGFTITPSRVGVLQAAGWSMAAATFDNTQFHDFVFDWAPGGSWQLYRDGVLVQSGSGGGAVSANRIAFGDGTGGANAHGDIRAFRFIQDVATPAASTTWGRIKGLYR